MNDLTQGNISKQFIFLSLPLIMGDFLQQLYNMLDSLIAGWRISENAFTAIGVAGSIMNLFIFIINGSCHGITILFSQFYGQKDYEKVQKETFVSLIFGFVLCFILSFVGIVFLNPILNLLNTPQLVYMDVYNYLRIINLFLAVTFFYNWSSSVLRAFGDSKAALYSLIISVVVNVILDLAFVTYWHRGVESLAYATIIAQGISSVCCVLYLLKKYPFILFHKKQLKDLKNLFLRTIKYGLVSALHQSSLFIGKLLIQSAINMCSISVVTAYAITTRIETLINSFGNSGSIAISILVGQNYGAGKKERIRDSLWIGGKIMALVCAVGCVCMVLACKPLTGLFVSLDHTRVVHETWIYIFVVALFYEFCFIGYAFVGYFKGLGWVNIPVIGTTMHVILRVILSILFVQKYGLLAVGLATGIGWACLNVYQVFVYRRKRIEM